MGLAEQQDGAAQARQYDAVSVVAGGSLMDWFEVEEARKARRNVAAEPVADQLKGLFNLMVCSPMPERLTELADRLEEAFQRGELNRTCAKRQN